ncbi:hypothetical protein ACFLQU_03260 [Verrucomicrobiota bacterium]
MARFAGLMGVPLKIVAYVAMKYINVLSVRGDHGKVKSILRDLALLNAVLSFFIVGSLYLFWGEIRAAMKVEDDRILWILAALAVLSCWSPVVLMVSQGLKRFHRIIFSRILGPVARLVVILLLLRKLQIAGYLMGNVAQPLAVIILLVAGLRRYTSRRVTCESYRQHLPEMVSYLWPIGAMTLITALQFAMGPWIVRQYFSPAESAGYYMAAMFGNIPMWVAPAMIPFLFPLASEQFERGESTRRMHLQALAVICVIGLGISLFLLLGGQRILALRRSWRTFQDYSPYVSLLALVATLEVLMRCHTLHEAACRRFGFLKYQVPVVAAELGALFLALTYWRSWVDMASVVMVMLVSRVITSVCIGVELLTARCE